jgi:NAD+ synthase
MSLANQIANWMESQVELAGSAGITVGLSGGVDSACVAGLAQKATPDAVVGVLMPCHSDPLDLEHGQLVADTFGIETVTVNLTPIYDSLLTALPTPADEQKVAGDRRMAEANLKPRLRMTTLYYIANLHNYLVAGTGNKSELLVGYFTKHGDGGADMLPLGDLYKREVYRLARDLGVPQPILERPPSAGLWVGQTDEEEMGLSYDTLERALITLSIGGDHGVPQPTLARVRQMMQDSEHKRALPPVFVQGTN